MEMKTLFLLPILLLSLISFSSWGADLQKAFDAFNRGDYETTLREFTPLAEQGNAVAQLSLGTMYRNGQGVQQDDKTAVKWFSLAAEQGLFGAPWFLGNMYRHGLSVPQDYKTAVKWYTLDAEQGHLLAQFYLGEMYAKGQGVPLENVRAHMWWAIAELSGHESASGNLEIVEGKMTSSQIGKAQKLARECVVKNYKGG